MYSLAEAIPSISRLLLLLAGVVFAAMMLRSIREENDMTSTTIKIAIPPIDAAAPMETKTATFALG